MDVGGVGKELGSNTTGTFLHPVRHRDRHCSINSSSSTKWQMEVDGETGTEDEEG